MNQVISNKKTMLAIVLSIAMVAAVGTTVSAHADTQSGNNATLQPPGKFIYSMPQIQGTIDISQLLIKSVKTTFIDAAKTAQSAVTGGTVTGGELGPYQGYYVYNFSVLDSSGKMHLVIVDAGNGQVLSKTDMPQGFSAMPGKAVAFGISGPAGDITYQNMGTAEGPMVIRTAPSQTK